MKKKTVDEITKEVMPLVNKFRQFPSKKECVVSALRVYFDIDSEYLYVIVKDGKFAESFVKKMGKGRMMALKKLLNVIDGNYYKDIDFGV